MSYQERESRAGFATGIFAGALLGAGLALLMAPKAGADLRGDIGESVGSLRDAVNRRYRELASRAGVTLDNLQDRSRRPRTGAVGSINRSTSAHRAVVVDAQQRHPARLKHPAPGQRRFVC